MTNMRAIIADDEENLRDHLKKQLVRLRPELHICAEAENGMQALACIERERPDIAFLDIKMPGLSGLEVAANMTVPCRVVLITAYDRYAVDAFEKGAVDYLLKPVSEERLAKTLARIRQQDRPATDTRDEVSATIRKLMAAAAGGPPTYLKWIRARHGEEIRLICADDVDYFQAQDKYTLVMHREGESLVRLTITQLEKELDPEWFWRIHRATIINVGRIERVNRSFTGTLSIRLKGHRQALTASRSYAHLFRQM